METELTKKIKMACHGACPKMSTKMRTIRFADEVLMPNGGLVDVVRFEDYVSSEKTLCRLMDASFMDDGYWSIFHSQNLRMGECKKGVDFAFPNEYCKGCVFKTSFKEIGMMVTCFEVKITLSDFKSANGHNFFGNENYYAVPSYLIPDVKDLIPPGIGLLSYYEKSGLVRVVKKSAFREITEEDKTFMLYNALKKWCDRKML